MRARGGVVRSQTVATAGSERQRTTKGCLAPDYPVTGADSAPVPKAYFLESPSSSTARNAS
jgi:hypothetical protein